jgi:hypothetical protein
MPYYRHRPTKVATREKKCARNFLEAWADNTHEPFATRLNMKFSATFERVTSTRAIVTLYDAQAEWAGAYRVDRPRNPRARLYDAGYDCAAREAVCKGGTLDRYREVAP